MCQLCYYFLKTQKLFDGDIFNMKKIALVFIIVYSIQTHCFSQSVYQYDLTKDIIIGTLALGIGMCPFFIQNNPGNTPETPMKNSVNDFDKHLMFAYNKPLDLFSDNFAYALALLPIISLMPNIKDSNSAITYGIMYGEALLLTYGTTFTIKNAVIRHRPYMYADGIPAGKEKDYYNSFPSGAVSFSFLSATFLSTTFSQEFPESKWKIPIIAGSYTLAAGVGAMRIVSGAHFLTDVLTSAAISSLFGWLIPCLHLKNDNERFTIIPAVDGIIVSMKF